MAGYSKASAERISMRPRLCGRNWQTDDVKAEKRCAPSPGLSALSGCMWNWMSGRATSAAERVKMATWLAARVKGPVRDSRYCMPIHNLLSGLLTSSLSVRSRVLKTNRTCR
jgi:hypothetical protein